MIYKCIKDFHTGYMIHQKGSWWEEISENTLRNIETGTMVLLSKSVLETNFEKYSKEL